MAKIDAVSLPVLLGDSSCDDVRDELIDPVSVQLGVGETDGV